MRDTTLRALRQLADVEWFRNVGKRDLKNAQVLPSWMEAIASCAAVEWENLQIDMANALTSRIARLDKERWAEWNGIVGEIKPETEALVQQKVARVVKEYGLPKRFCDTVEWDILSLAMEAEYSDIVPPAFYCALAFYYKEGHFPCGWEGIPPDGRVIVY